MEKKIKIQMWADSTRRLTISVLDKRSKQCNKNICYFVVLIYLGYATVSLQSFPHVDVGIHENFEIFVKQLVRKTQYTLTFTET